MSKIAPDFVRRYFFMRLYFLLFGLCVWGCSKNETTTEALFTDISKISGIDFNNNLAYTEELNPYTYRNFYNGAGVAIGDINNDGLLDIYFAGNQVSNKLYLNLGNLKFKDITETAGVACTGVWSTGVTFVDINTDGLLDIYVCKSGDPDVSNRHNELFINNGDLTFTEKSAEYGLDVVGLSVQAAFFDYDKDGDLDCYLLTNSFKSVGNFDLIKDQRQIPDSLNAGNKFFVNENGKFIDYTAQANIYRSNIGFGLGITLGDFNNDSWTDIFISNDFFERDYLYINDQHGSFKESLTDYFQSISMGSMGADFADLDGDGIAELFVTEMLPDSLHRKKTKTVYENWDKNQLNIQNGYHFQVPRNVLQKKTSEHSYVELGRLAGIAASEWSWGALLFDMNNDGKRDIFIANGIVKDLLDRDYLTYTGAEENVKRIIREEKDPIVMLIDLMPSSPMPNYAYLNEGNLSFRNRAREWGLEQPMFSSGSAYGDLDNDGDLDLVVNNINSPSILYRNNSDSSTYKSLSVKISSETKNTSEVGSQVIAYCDGKPFFADNFVTRGYQSSVSPEVVIGLGEGISRVDSLIIWWPDIGYTLLRDLKVNQKIHIIREKSKILTDRLNSRPTRSTISLELISNNLYKHKGSGLIDFNRDRLLPMMYSNETPALLKGDIDKDGVNEIYIGGGKDQAGSFIDFNQTEKWDLFTPKNFMKYSLGEETNGALFDVDNDGDLDFYQATGGRFFPAISDAQQDRIFLNNGKGDFFESPYPLPFTGFISTSVVKPIDFDNDGDLDLFIGERFDPFIYGNGGGGFLFQNDGKGLFKDVTVEYAPDLIDIGMITDASVADIDNDGWTDLVLVGDWMPIISLRNNKGRFYNSSKEMNLSGTEGWWHTIEVSDLNKDGRPDFVLGNHGLNSFFKSGDRMYVNDFDANGSIEQIFTTRESGKYYPIFDKDELISQLPSLKKSILYYKDYGDKSIDELFNSTTLQSAHLLQVNLLTSVILLSGPGGYQQVDLPLEAQYSPIYGLLLDDLDNDGVVDLVAGGNQYQVKPQFGRQDASHAWFFKGALKDGKFYFNKGQDLNVKGQIRDIELIEVNGDKFILFAKHDDELEIYKIHD
jgi:enediyne biosynthesis protein E4